MRFFVLLAAAATLVSASMFGDSEPDVAVSGAFPDSNQFGKVVNYEKNTLFVTVENRSPRNVTIRSIAGSLHNPLNNKLVKNTTTFAYPVELTSKAKISIPYIFQTETKPGDARLQVWLDHTFDGKKFRVPAYDSIVTIVEPPVSIFDFELISTYLIVLGMFAGLAYWAYQTFTAEAKPTRKNGKTVLISAPIEVVATGAGGYQDEWIPEHHVRKAKGAKVKGARAVSGLTSGEETSGTEGVAAEGKAKSRKSRK